MGYTVHCCLSDDADVVVVVVETRHCAVVREGGRNAVDWSAMVVVEGSAVPVAAAAAAAEKGRQGSDDEECVHCQSAWADVAW